jgi:hypothetical protein
LRRSVNNNFYAPERLPFLYRAGFSRFSPDTARKKFSANFSKPVLRQIENGLTTGVSNLPPQRGNQNSPGHWGCYLSGQMRLSRLAIFLVLLCVADAKAILQAIKDGSQPYY